MTAEELALAASVFFSGLAAGFLGGLCTILRPMHRDRRCRRHLQRVEDTHLQDDPCLGPRGDGSGLGGGTAALLHDQLDPIRDHLGGVRPLPASPWRGPVSVVSNSASDAVNSASATRENIRD